MPSDQQAAATDGISALSSSSAVLKPPEEHALLASLRAGLGAKEAKSASLAAVATWIDILSIGILTSTTAGTTVYNRVMGDGLLPGMTAIVIGGIGLGTLMLCLAELTSAIPFAGATYGFVRVTVGRHTAVICGLVEVVMYGIGNFSLVCRVAMTITWATGMSRHLEVLWTFLVYVLCVVIHARQARIFWRSMRWLAVLSMAVQFVYWGLAFSTPINLAKNAALPGASGIGAYLRDGKLSPFLSQLPTGVFLYSGIEGLVLSVEDTIEPRRQVPRGMVVSMGLVTVFAIATSLVVLSATPGLVAMLPYFFPITPVVEELMGGNKPAPAMTVACLLAMPSSIGGVLGSFHVASRAVFAMARAGALPKALSTVQQGVAVKASLTCAVVGWLAGATVLLSDSVYLGYVGVAAMTMCSLFNYNLSLVAYILLRLRFPDLPRDFTSPLGVTGAVVGLVIIWAATVSLFIYVPGASLGIVLIVLIVGLLWSYYCCYAQRHLKLSPEELISIDMQISRDVVPEELLGDLQRLIELEEQSHVPVIASMCDFARQLCCEESIQYALAVVKIRHMSLAIKDRPAVLGAAQTLMAKHTGEGAEMPVTMAQHYQTRITKLLWKLSRRQVLFLDDMQELLEGLTLPLSVLSVQLSSVLNNFAKAELGGSLWSSSPEGRARSLRGSSTPTRGSRRSSVQQQTQEGAEKLLAGGGGMKPRRLSSKLGLGRVAPAPVAALPACPEGTLRGQQE